MMLAANIFRGVPWIIAIIHEMTEPHCSVPQQYLGEESPHSPHGSRRKDK
jgi:hypothetical protein